jgi:two-component system chemotaxis response regulator CheB
MKIKILIADSSSVYRIMFARTISESDTAVSYALDGEEALRLIGGKKFDVIVIDAEIGGIGALELVKSANMNMPDALILITARPSPENSRLCAEALTAGALDCMIKPIHASYAENLEAVTLKMSNIFKIFYEKRKKRGIRRKIIKPVDAADSINTNDKDDMTDMTEKFKAEIVLIAASTGGPQALENILSKLSADFPAPILIVQHMPPQFIENLAQGLNTKSALRIKPAEEGEIASAGTVYLASGGLHTKLEKADSGGRIYFDASPPISGIRPAANALFESAAESFPGRQVLAVILSGMGRDGEAGLKKLKEKCECLCFVQSEKTCVVYGMPRAAAESGFADKILDLDEIALEIMKHTKHTNHTEEIGK